MRRRLLCLALVCSMACSLRAQFVLYNALAFTGAPSHTYAPYLYGFTLDYGAAIASNSCTPNNVNILSYANAGLSNPTWPVSFDVELNSPSWPTSGTPLTDSINHYINMIDTFKARNSSSPISFYGLPPYPDCYDWAGVNSYLTNVSSAMTGLASVVDYFSPSFYNHNTDDTTSWRKYVDTVIAVIHKYYGAGKPIYPYIWPQYDGGSKNGDLMDTATWQFELNYLYAKASGAVIWSGSGSAWDANAAWWQVTKEFMVKKGLASPLVIDNFSFVNTGGSGRQLQWTTSSDTTTQYYVIERSADDVDFSPVSGNIARSGGYYALNNYTFSDTVAASTPVYYRLRAVAYGGMVAYRDTLSYPFYRSLGTGVTVDLASAANWQVQNAGGTWVSATSAPDGITGGNVIIQSVDTWQNNIAASVIQPGVTVIDSGATGTFSTSGTLKNSGAIIFCGTGIQTIPGSAALAVSTWGNIVINNANGVTSTQSTASSFLHVGALSLTTGTFTVTASAGKSVSLNLDGPIIVGNGNLDLTNTATNYGASLNGKAPQSIAAGTFLNNTVNILDITSLGGATYGGTLTVTSNIKLSAAGTLTGGSNISMGSLSIDTLSTSPQITASDTAVIGGVLTVTGKFFTPPYLGERFTIVSAGTLIGSFSSVSLPSGYSGTVADTGNTAVLTITALPYASYRSQGTGVAVDLNTTANWQTYSGGAWISAVSAPGTLTSGAIVIRPGDTWNNASSIRIPVAVTIADSGATGTFSTANQLRDSGTVVFCGTAAQTLPIATAFTSQTIYGNLIINNPAGVTSTGYSYLNISGALQLSTGTLKSGGGSFYLDGPVLSPVVNSSGSSTLGSATIVGFYGGASQTIAANLFTANTVGSLYIQNNAGVVVAPDAVFNVSGTLNLQAGTLYLSNGDSLMLGGAVLYTSGSLSAPVGSVLTFNGTSVQAIPAGVFSGNSVNTLVVNNASGISLAGPLCLPGQLVVDNLSSATIPLQASGQIITVGGLLNVASFTGTPKVGNAYTIISAGTLSGAFSSLTLPAGYGGSLSYTSGSVVLTITQLISPDRLQQAGAMTVHTEPDSISTMLKLFPNPATGTVILNHAPAGTSASVRILTIDGRMVGAIPVVQGSVQTSLDVSRLASGYYIVSYYDGKRLSSLGLVKLH